jgi:hypothetical protein
MSSRILLRYASLPDRDAFSIWPGDDDAARSSGDLYVLWKVFVTNKMDPRGGVCVLGLTETSATHAEMYGRRIAWKMLALYVATSFLTFNLGLMAFDLYYYVTGLLSSLLD